MEMFDKKNIEQVSGLKVRKGFEKLLPLAVRFFNYTQITKKEAVKIIEFVNRSNTALSESYWILRKGYSLEEAKVEKQRYCESFINSSYKHTNRRVVGKRFVGVNKSRGYSGVAVIKGKEYYCRSQFEFIIVNYLHEIYKSHSIEYEHSIYQINSTRAYKPDFFIFKNGILEKIIEVKSSKKFIE